MNLSGNDRLWKQIAAQQDQSAPAQISGSTVREFLARDQVPARTGELGTLAGAPARNRDLRVAWRRGSVLAVALATAAAVAVFYPRHPHPEGLTFQIAGTHPQVGHVVTALGEKIPVAFSDGSRFEIQPGAQIEVVRAAAEGAEIVLRAGQLLTRVRHRENTHWVVRAGVFSIAVTGTYFQTGFFAGENRVVVELYEGSVVVSGGPLAGGVSLKAGQRLEASAGTGAFSVRSLQAEAAVPTRAPVATAAQVAHPVVTATAHPAAEVPARSSWRQLAEQNRHNEALQAAEAEGFEHLCRTLAAADLLALGDTARYAEDPGRARLAFQMLVKRFPSDAMSADAVFSLARVAFDARDFVEADRWFAHYAGKWPDGPFHEQAMGRWMESLASSGNQREALGIARSYLVLYPGGDYRGFAERLLAGAGK